MISSFVSLARICAIIRDRTSVFTVSIINLQKLAHLFIIYLLTVFLWEQFFAEEA